MIFSVIVLQTLIAISNAIHHEPSCGPTYRQVTETAGSFVVDHKGRLPDADLFDCFWALKTTPGKKIDITITELTIGPPEIVFKKTEGLFIYNVANNESDSGFVWFTNLKKGHSRTYTSLGFNMFVQLHTPLMSTYCTFMATYKAVDGVKPDQHDSDICGNKEINVAKANDSWVVPINGKAAVNKQCLWRLSAGNGKRVQVTIKSISFYSDFNCSTNRIDFFDGGDDRAKFLGTICKTDGSRTFRSTGNQLTVKFSAWNISKGEGFKGAYSEIAGSKGQKIAFSAIWILATLLAPWCIHY